jgi:hypothetical protein
VEGSCEHGNELSCSIKCWEVLEWLHNWRLHKDWAPWVSEWMLLSIFLQIPRLNCCKQLSSSSYELHVLPISSCFILFINNNSLKLRTQRLLSYGVKRRVILWKSTDISEAIFSFEKSAFTEIHGVISQKTELLVTTAVISEVLHSACIWTGQLISGMYRNTENNIPNWLQADLCEWKKSMGQIAGRGLLQGFPFQEFLFFVTCFQQFRFYSVELEIWTLLWMVRNARECTSSISKFCS